MARPNKFQRTVSEYLDYLREVKGASPHTAISYECDLKHLASWLEEKGEPGSKPHWQQVTHLHLRRYFNGMQGYAISSQNRQLSAIRGFFKWLETEGAIKSNPTTHLSPFKEQNLDGATSQGSSILSIEEIERLLDAPDILSARGKRDRALLEVLYGTGLRVSECAALALGDIDWRAGELCLRELSAAPEQRGRKTKVSRVLPLGRPALAALRDYVQNARPELEKGVNPATKPPATDALWLSRRGVPMSPVTIYLAVQSCARQAGLNEKITPHTLRLSCGAHLLQNGADEGVVRELLGHRSFQFMRTYQQQGAKERSEPQRKRERVPRS